MHGSLLCIVFLNNITIYVNLHDMLAIALSIKFQLSFTSSLLTSLLFSSHFLPPTVSVSRCTVTESLSCEISAP